MIIYIYIYIPAEDALDDNDPGVLGIADVGGAERLTPSHQRGGDSERVQACFRKKCSRVGRIAPRVGQQRLPIRDSVKKSTSAILQFCYSVIPMIAGCQPDLAGPGPGRRQAEHNAGATQHKRYRLHIFIIPSKHLELICIADSCSYFAVGVNINKILSCFGSQLVADLRLDVSMSRPVSLTQGR